MGVDRGPDREAGRFRPVGDRDARARRKPQRHRIRILFHQPSQPPAARQRALRHAGRVRFGSPGGGGSRGGQFPYQAGGAPGGDREDQERRRRAGAARDAEAGDRRTRRGRARETGNGAASRRRFLGTLRELSPPIVTPGRRAISSNIRKISRSSASASTRSWAAPAGRFRESTRFIPTAPLQLPEDHLFTQGLLPLVAALMSILGLPRCAVCLVGNCKAGSSVT